MRNRRRRPLSVGQHLYEMRTHRMFPVPLTYHGVTFRSTFEAHFAFHLDMKGEEWVYEPRRYGPRGRSYLPDFQILSAARPTFVELKPLLKDVPDAQAKMSVIWESVPDALLIVATAEQRRFYVALKDQEWSWVKEEWAA